jgi:23S rRNA (adenine2503-C2)-methyltransferase
MDKDLKNYTPAELRRIVDTFGQKCFLSDYLFSFIHQKYVVSLDEVSPLPKSFRAELQAAGYFVSCVALAEQHQDPDGTVKFVFELSGGSRIEAVRLCDQDRNTLCLSTQAGCRMGCLFCATGQLKFERNLTAAEIVDQVYHAQRQCGRIHNLVYMGMGEPLDNFDNVMRSVELLNHEKGANIGIRHITLSTCGLPDAIRKLADCDLHPRLAVSLHAADDATRNKLMRVSQKYALSEILESLKDYQQKTSRRITIEYCLMNNVNDSNTQARLLIRLLKEVKANVNLIEMNPFPGCPFEPSTPERMRAFAQILTDAGIDTIVRFRRGRSIKAACGQLGATRLKPH